jgi:hypothetical protein
MGTLNLLYIIYPYPNTNTASIIISFIKLLVETKNIFFYYNAGSSAPLGSNTKINIIVTSESLELSNYFTIKSRRITIDKKLSYA